MVELTIELIGVVVIFFVLPLFIAYILFETAKSTKIKKEVNTNGRRTAQELLDEA